MSSKTDIVRPRIVKVYELDQYEKLIKGMRVAACMFHESTPIADEQSVIKRLNALILKGSSDGNACSCCGVGPFNTRAEQVAHYKHHWHTYNLKLKLFGKPPVTFANFNAREDDDSSVSGSDSEGEDTSKKPASDLFAAATRHCKAFFTNQSGQVFCIYRCILHNRKEQLSSDGDGHAWTDRVQKLAIPVFQRWAVFMVTGGHFAGAVFSGGVPVVHKSLHAYVKRRGPVRAQVTADRHAPRRKPAAAKLRRYNQAQFLQNVQDIVASWEKSLVGCYLILYRAAGSTNQAALFGKKTSINRDDPRVRALPFPTRKPTFKEVLRTHETVASVEVYETIELFQKALIDSTAKPVKTGSASSAKPVKTGSDSSVKAPKQNTPKPPVDNAKSRVDSEAEDVAKKGQTAKEQNTKKPAQMAQPEINNYVKKVPQKIPNKVKKMWKFISGEENSLETILETWKGDLLEACNIQDPTDGNTALHKAAIADKPSMVTEMLAAGGDPCIKNNLLQTPYAAAPHQDTRVAFRLFQAQFPDKYNYAKSQIPGPLTPELLEQEKEKKAQQKRAKRQRDKEKQAEKNQTNNFLLMTDAQKVMANEPRCFLCGIHLPKKPFTYDTYRFCSIRCLKNHRNLRPLHMSA